MSTLKTNNIQHVDRSEPSILIDTSGRVSIAGTLTYEDVTNVDSVGIVTARGLSIFGNTTGLKVASGISTFQAITATTGEFSDDVVFTGATRVIRFDKSADALEFNDEMKATFGNSGDLVISHSGTASQIQEVGTGSLHITTNGTLISIDKGATESMANFKTDGAVELFYDNSKKIETSPSGVDVSGTLNATGISTFTAGIRCTTDGVANGVQIGAGSDLILQHNGTNSFIDNNTGDLYIQTTGSGDDILIEAADNVSIKVHWSEDGINITGDGAVQLYYDNSEKIKTTSSGVTVTGSATMGGATVNSGSINMSSSHMQFSGNLSLPNVGACLFRPVADTIAFGINNGQRVSVNQHGLLFGTDTASSNALADYEEGTFTPTLYYGSGTSEPTYSFRYAHYIKVGKQVTIWFMLGIASFTASYTEAYIGGLPFQAADPNAQWKYLNHLMGYSYASGWGDGGSDKHMFLAIYDNQTKMMINHEGNHLSTGNIGSGQRFSCTVTYQTD